MEERRLLIEWKIIERKNSFSYRWLLIIYFMVSDREGKKEEDRSYGKKVFDYY